MSVHSQTSVKQAPLFKKKAEKWLLKTFACLIQVNSFSIYVIWKERKYTQYIRMQIQCLGRFNPFTLRFLTPVLWDPCWAQLFKLTMPLVNVSLRLEPLNMAYTLIFLLKTCAYILHLLLTFSAKIPVNLISYFLEQLTFWPLTSSLS